MGINRRYKDTVFRDLFGAPERRANALSLYDALSGTAHSDPAELEITTLDDVLYMGVKNDVSLIIDDTMMLWEHQSTHNPNMPLRGLWYFAQLYTRWVDAQDRSVYGSVRIELPTPRYYVFYVGEDERTEREVMRLSDSFACGPGDLEVSATVININQGHNPWLAEGCPVLADYAALVARARANRAAGMGMARAVSAAIDECIGEGVLADYLASKKAEVSEMFMTEYDEAKTMRQLRREYAEEGRAEGRAQGRAEGRAEAHADTLQGVMGLLRDGLISVEAAERLGFTQAELGVSAS